MEGGLALMWFRMLLWVCGLALVFSQDTTVPTATIKILPEKTMEARQGDSVTLDCKISPLQSIDEVLWSRRSSLSDTQQFIADENGLNQALTNRRFSISPLRIVNSEPALYSQNITIVSVQQSDQGYYQCFVKKEQRNVTKSKEEMMSVHLPHVFPVCVPNGPARVNIDSSLSCKTISKTRKPKVAEKNNPNEADGWTNDTEQKLKKAVTKSDQNKTYHCYSKPYSSERLVECTIGPLTVVHEPKITKIMLFSIIIVNLLITAIILIVLLFICSQYDPRCWLQRGTPRQENNRRTINSWFGYELPPTVPITATPGATSTPPETSEQLRGVINQSSTPSQENNRNTNDPWEGYEIPSAITVTSGATSTPPETSEQLQGVINQSSTPRQENNRNANDPLEGYETPSAITATLGTRLNTAFHSVIYSS